MATTKLEGKEVKLSGAELNVGDMAPVITLVGKDLKDHQVGGQKGCAQIIVVVPSLDTDVCADEERRYNEEASKLENLELSIVSMDLPFAMERFCTTEGIENLKFASDFRSKVFAKSYGVLQADGPFAGLACRAVFIINASGIITYKEICEEISQEPNYAKVLAAVGEATSTSCCGSCQ